VTSRVFIADDNGFSDHKLAWFHEGKICTFKVPTVISSSGHLLTNLQGMPFASYEVRNQIFVCDPGVQDAVDFSACFKDRFPGFVRYWKIAEQARWRSKLFDFFDAHTPNAMYSLQMGARGMSSISGNFYPEILVWMCNNANNPAKQADVQWLQSELTRVDPLIHQAYPMSAKYFLQLRGLPVRTISRAYVQELTPAQKDVLKGIYDSFTQWCGRLNITPADIRGIMEPKILPDPAI